ncbi:hypothetical protein Cadr_000026335 [Camelus dromedarius]|uniref:Uncharacterized protein n=1 Tax=Camelus dromedarius TaxID=9838 RepID=A0A5N4CEW4_CAMDR|nr:hypothetical protein Cadr_000026335 [Camelus dromedarius]
MQACPFPTCPALQELSRDAGDAASGQEVAGESQELPQGRPSRSGGEKTGPRSELALGGGAGGGVRSNITPEQGNQETSPQAQKQPKGAARGEWGRNQATCVALPKSFSDRRLFLTWNLKDAGFILRIRTSAFSGCYPSSRWSVLSFVPSVGQALCWRGRTQRWRSPDCGGRCHSDACTTPSQGEGADFPGRRPQSPVFSASRGEARWACCPTEGHTCQAEQRPWPLTTGCQQRHTPWLRQPDTVSSPCIAFPVTSTVLTTVTMLHGKRPGTRETAGWLGSPSPASAGVPAPRPRPAPSPPAPHPPGHGCFTVLLSPVTCERATQPHTAACPSLPHLLRLEVLSPRPFRSFSQCGLTAAGPLSSACHVASSAPHPFKHLPRRASWEAVVLCPEQEPPLLALLLSRCLSDLGPSRHRPWEKDLRVSHFWRSDPGDVGEGAEKPRRRGRGRRAEADSPDPHPGCLRALPEAVAVQAPGSQERVLVQAPTSWRYVFGFLSHLFPQPVLLGGPELNPRKQSLSFLLRGCQQGPDPAFSRAELPAGRAWPARTCCWVKVARLSAEHCRLFALAQAEPTGALLLPAPHLLGIRSGSVALRGSTLRETRPSRSPCTEGAPMVPHPHLGPCLHAQRCCPARGDHEAPRGHLLVLSAKHLFFGELSVAPLSTCALQGGHMTQLSPSECPSPRNSSPVSLLDGPAEVRREKCLPPWGCRELTRGGCDGRMWLPAAPHASAPGEHGGVCGVTYTAGSKLGWTRRWKHLKATGQIPGSAQGGVGRRGERWGLRGLGTRAPSLFGCGGLPEALALALPRGPAWASCGGSRNDGQVSHTAVAASPWGERKSGCTVYPTVGNAEGFAHVEKPSREQRCGQCPKGTDALHSSAAVAGRPLGSHRPGSTVHLRWGPESSLSGWRRLGRPAPWPQTREQGHLGSSSRSRATPANTTRGKGERSPRATQKSDPQNCENPSVLGWLVVQLQVSHTARLRQQAGPGSLGGAGPPATPTGLNELLSPRNEVCLPGARDCSSHLRSRRREVPVLPPLCPWREALAATGRTRPSSAGTCAGPQRTAPFFGAGSERIHLHELVAHLVILMPSHDQGGEAVPAAVTVMLGPPVQGAPPGLKSSRSAFSRNVDHPPTTALGVFTHLCISCVTWGWLLGLSEALGSSSVTCPEILVVRTKSENECEICTLTRAIHTRVASSRPLFQSDHDRRAGGDIDFSAFCLPHQFHGPCERLIRQQLGEPLRTGLSCGRGSRGSERPCVCSEPQNSNLTWCRGQELREVDSELTFPRTRPTTTAVSWGLVKDAALASAVQHCAGERPETVQQGRERRAHQTEKQEANYVQTGGRGEPRNGPTQLLSDRAAEVIHLRVRQCFVGEGGARRSSQAPRVPSRGRPGMEMLTGPGGHVWGARPVQLCIRSPELKERGAADQPLRPWVAQGGFRALQGLEPREEGGSLKRPGPCVAARSESLQPSTAVSRGRCWASRGPQGPLHLTATASVPDGLQRVTAAGLGEGDNSSWFTLRAAQGPREACFQFSPRIGGGGSDLCRAGGCSRHRGALADLEGPGWRHFLPWVMATWTLSLQLHGFAFIEGGASRFRTCAGLPGAGLRAGLQALPPAQAALCAWWPKGHIAASRPLRHKHRPPLPSCTSPRSRSPASTPRCLWEFRLRSLSSNLQRRILPPGWGYAELRDAVVWKAISSCPAQLSCTLLHSREAGTLQLNFPVLPTRSPERRPEGRRRGKSRISECLLVLSLLPRQQSWVQFPGFLNAPQSARHTPAEEPRETFPLSSCGAAALARAPPRRPGAQPSKTPPPAPLLQVLGAGTQLLPFAPPSTCLHDIVSPFCLFSPLMPARPAPCVTSSQFSSKLPWDFPRPVSSWFCRRQPSDFNWNTCSPGSPDCQPTLQILDLPASKITAPVPSFPGRVMRGGEAPGADGCVEHPVDGVSHFSDDRQEPEKGTGVERDFWRPQALGTAACSRSPASLKPWSLLLAAGAWRITGSP